MESHRRANTGDSFPSNQIFISSLFLFLWNLCEAGWKIQNFKTSWFFTWTTDLIDLTAEPTWYDLIWACHFCLSDADLVALHCQLRSTKICHTKFIKEEFHNNCFWPLQNFSTLMPQKNHQQWLNQKCCYIHHIVFPPFHISSYLLYKTHQFFQNDPSSFYLSNTWNTELVQFSTQFARVYKWFQCFLQVGHFTSNIVACVLVHPNLWVCLVYHVEAWTNVEMIDVTNKNHAHSQWLFHNSGPNC